MKIKWTTPKIVGFTIAGIFLLVAFLLPFGKASDAYPEEVVVVSCIFALLAFFTFSLPVLIINGRKEWGNFLKELIFKD